MKIARSTPKRAPAQGGTKPEPILHLPAAPGLGEVTIRVGDCRDMLPRFPQVAQGSVDLVFADPPFNWNRKYDRWNDALPEEEYLTFTYDWLDLCVNALRPGGSFFVNIPDDWAAEITCYLKGRPVLLRDRRRTAPARLDMVNWCIWHYRFGQNTRSRFINSKVHVLYFVKHEDHAHTRTWNPAPILELSDRAAIYFDPRTESKKDGMPPRLRVPMDVWYGKHWGRVQGNNKERRGYHDNQLPEVYLERVIRCASNEGDTVLDPFVGSGTTAVLARALNRRFIGTEFSPENAASARDRIAKGPLRLSGDSPQSTAIFSPRRRKPAPKSAT